MCSSRETSMKSYPDASLVERARARDALAFRELVARHDRRLRSLVSRFVDTPSDQEDVIQNALLAAWRHLPAFEGRAQFGSWMYQVTTNSALMLLRGRRRTPASLVGDVDEWAGSRPGMAGEPYCGVASCWIGRPDEAMQRAELRALLQRKVGELPPRLREVFVLRCVDGLSVKETGEALGLTGSTVKTRLHRACLALRASIHQSAADVAICRNRKRVSSAG
jgi:RNA polymerase sigma-70 factor, ECF subfamily